MKNEKLILIGVGLICAYLAISEIRMMKFQKAFKQRLEKNSCGCEEDLKD